MTKFEYETLIFPPNLFHNLDEFQTFIQVKEEGWEQGLKNLLQVCVDHELYEYCEIIKNELEK